MFPENSKFSWTREALHDDSSDGVARWWIIILIAEGAKDVDEDDDPDDNQSADGEEEVENGNTYANLDHADVFEQSAEAMREENQSTQNECA